MSKIEQYETELVKKIPAVSALGVHIFEVYDNKVILSAPLRENINYEGTAFGGSLNTVSVLSCYLMMHHLLKTQNIDFSSLVIQSSSINYLKPTETDFYSVCELPDDAKVYAFLKSLDERKRGRLRLQSCIRTKTQGENKVEFEGRFVVKI